MVDVSFSAELNFHPNHGGIQALREATLRFRQVRPDLMPEHACLTGFREPNHLRDFVLNIVKSIFD